MGKISAVLLVMGDEGKYTIDEGRWMRDEGPGYVIDFPAPARAFAETSAMASDGRFIKNVS